VRRITGPVALAIAISLIVIAAVAYESAIAAMRLTASCRGGIGAGSSLGLLGIFIFSVTVFGAPVAALGGHRWAKQRRIDKFAQSIVVLISAAAVPLASVLFVSIAASGSKAPLSCVRAYVAAGGMPDTIVTVFSDSATLWRTREEPKPRPARSPTDALQEACRAASESSLFLVTHTPWSPPRGILDACGPRVFQLSPAAS